MTEVFWELRIKPPPPSHQWKGAAALIHSAWRWRTLLSRVLCISQVKLESLFYALYSHGQSELLFQSRDQLQRHRSAQKELFTERPVNQGDGFTQWPTSCHGHDIYQSQWTKYFVASLSSLQQLSAAVVYNRRALPEHLWSGHHLTNYTRGVIDHLCVTAEFKPFGGRAGMVGSV